MRVTSNCTIVIPVSLPYPPGHPVVRCEAGIVVAPIRTGSARCTAEVVLAVSPERVGAGPWNGGRGRKNKVTAGTALALTRTMRGRCHGAGSPVTPPRIMPGRTHPRTPQSIASSAPARDRQLPGDFWEGVPAQENIMPRRNAPGAWVCVQSETRLSAGARLRE